MPKAKLTKIDYRNGSMSEIPDAHDILHLGRLTLRLGQVTRITYHSDGTTPESDTDHTVMLGLVAPAFAARFMPGLDLGLVALLALVHDLPEVYAGDTPTLRITAEQRAAKHHREAEARARLAGELTSLPLIPHLIELYETRGCPEARYVWAMDKLLPKITHILNWGATLREQLMLPAELRTRYEDQLIELREVLGDQFEPLFELREQLIAWVMTIPLRGGTRPGVAKCGSPS